MNIDDKYYTVNLDKRSVIEKIISEEGDEELDLTQPVRDGLNGYRYEFAIPSNWKYSNRRVFYYYTKNQDHTYWVVEVRGKSVNKSREKIPLGSFNKFDFKISCNWRATQLIAKESKDGTFVRKDVENVEPTACGNNRSPSGAAFRLFQRLNLIQLFEDRGNKEVWRLSGLRPKITNLDYYMNNTLCNESKVNTNLL